MIFTSDNGGSGFTNNIPLSKGKNFIYEGGVRVPFIVKGPNINANTISTVPVIAYDIFPTIVEWMTGNTASVPTSVDGTSLVPILHNTGSITRQNPIVFHNPHHNSNHADKVPRSAIVEGNYKFLTNYETGVFELYDLDTDIGEITNIFTTQTGVAQDLYRSLRDYLKEVTAVMPTLNPQFVTNSGSANDIDNDGLDDDWEFRELLTTHYDGTDDPDGDGFDNLTEFNDGTDPYGTTLSNNSLEREDNIQLFPNPTKDRLEITVEKSATVQVFTVTGQLIHQFAVQNKATIDVSKWEKGIYFLTFEEEGGMFTKRVVVQQIWFTPYPK